MYKKSNGKTGFSFGRLITNTVPNFANDNAADDANFPPKQQDALFAHQMSLDNPKIFDDLSLFASGTVEAKQHSRSVLNTLQKIGIVNKTDGSIHTELITKHFPNQVSILSIHKQRRVVSLLFFWEEELTRWRLLDEEESEIRKAMEEHGEEHEALKIALGTVRVKRSIPPSLRDNEGSTNMAGGGVEGAGPSRSSGGNAEDQPPAYHDTKRTLSISGGKSHAGEAGPITDGTQRPTNAGDEKRDAGDVKE